MDFHVPKIELIKNLSPPVVLSSIKKPYAESFITIRPQRAKLWPKMVFPWWPKNELIKKMTPPSVVDGKIVFTL